MPAAPNTTPIDPRALGRLKWRCRRGLLENDLLLERFFNQHGATLSGEQARGLEALVALDDNDLLDLLLGRVELGGSLDRAEVRNVLALLRPSGAVRHASSIFSDSAKELP